MTDQFKVTKRYSLPTAVVLLIEREASSLGISPSAYVERLLTKVVPDVVAIAMRHDMETGCGRREPSPIKHETNNEAH